MKEQFLALSVFLAAPMLGSSPILAQDTGHKHMHDMEMHQKAAKVMVHAVINRVDAAKRIVNISHEPIDALGWPAMTMDMAVGPDVDLSVLAPGQKIMASMAKGPDGIYRLENIMIHGTPQ